MSRRRGRMFGIPSVRGLLLLVAVVLVLAGGAGRVYHLFPRTVSTDVVVVAGLAAVAIYFLGQFRRWWRGTPPRR